MIASSSGRGRPVIALAATLVALVALSAGGCAGIKAPGAPTGGGSGGGGGQTHVTVDGGQQSRPDGPAKLPDADSCVKVACTQATGQYCGMIGDGCSGVQDCGACPADKICEKGVCVGGAACVAAACPTTGALKYCGSIGDGCGRALDCGTCGGGLTCRDGICVDPACVPMHLQRREQRSVLRVDRRRLRRLAQLHLHHRDLRRRRYRRRLRQHHLRHGGQMQPDRRRTVLRHHRQRLWRRPDLPRLPGRHGLPGQRRLPRVDHAPAARIFSARFRRARRRPRPASAARSTTRRARTRSTTSQVYVPNAPLDPVRGGRLVRQVQRHAVGLPDRDRRCRTRRGTSR